MSRDIATREERPSLAESRETRAIPHLLRDKAPRDQRRNLSRVPSPLGQSERITLQEVGRFRTVNSDDLLRHRYAGDEARMRQELRSLLDRGLMQRRTVWTEKSERLAILVLTKRGKLALESTAGRDVSQRVYAGFVKPAEVRHDAAIYRMYQEEARQIAQTGGRIKRVVLDYELKERIFSRLGKIPRAQAREYAKRQAEVAQDNHLKVVRGKILLPDLRIEYETAEGERSHIDLELATEHYRGSQMQGKAAAGFKMYAPASSVSGLSRVCDDHRIVTEILSL